MTSRALVLRIVGIVQAAQPDEDVAGTVLHFLLREGVWFAREIENEDTGEIVSVPLKRGRRVPALPATQERLPFG
jgi:hypothetical protein